MEKIETPKLAKFFNVLGAVGLAIGIVILWLVFSTAAHAQAAGGFSSSAAAMDYPNPVSTLAGGFMFAMGLAVVISSCLMLAVGSVLTYLNRISIFTERLSQQGMKTAGPTLS